MEGHDGVEKGDWGYEEYLNAVYKRKKIILLIRWTN